MNGDVIIQTRDHKGRWLDGFTACGEIDPGEWTIELAKARSVSATRVIRVIEKFEKVDS